MANIDIADVTGSTRVLGRGGMGLMGVFTLSIFLSAFLLFSVQPMFTKLVLPLLGGSSNVWNTAMVFFQAMLLGGYIYAHVISKYLRLGWQIICHGVLLGIGGLFLPLSIAAGWTPPTGGAQAFWLIGLFAVSVGVPFFAISANSPLLQRWFSRTNNPDADDPYFLYAASNAGSLLSLALYPILFEPFLRLQEQTHIWAYGYGALIAVIVAAGIWALRNPGESGMGEIDVPRAQIKWKTRAFWIFLAFIPSSLMLGVTSHMANNIASAPFLWIVPLALYLTTFIIVFAKKPIVTTAGLARLFPAVIVVALVAGFVIKMMVLLSIGLSLLCYFIIALLCHSRLADERPDASNLTEFYIWMSVGGVLGGIFNALLAPVLFTNVYEYLIVLLIASFAVPKVRDVAFDYKPMVKFGLKFVLPAALVFVALSLTSLPTHIKVLLVGVPVVFGLGLLRKQGKLVFLDAAVFIGICFYLPTVYLKPILTDRSFFSILHVKTAESEFGTVHKFIHGDTLHNFQMRAPELRTVPLAYYGPGNTFDQALSLARSQNAELNVAMVGLGAGAMACYEQPGDNWTYYEIDPAVVEMAMNPDYFSFMQDCATDPKVIIGDARMTITTLPEKSQDIIVIDAFSSDSVPAHLVTVEALELYKTKLKDDGLIFFHTSNRIMDISSVVVQIAGEVGLDSRYIMMNDFSKFKYGEFYVESHGVLVGNPAQIEALTDGDLNWMEYIPSPHVKPWTDDYSSVLATIKSHVLREASVVKQAP